MSFRVLGLDPAPFLPLYTLDAAALAARGVLRVTADADPGFPDRVEMRDAARGQTLLLLNHEHQPAKSPYRASHAIFVREGAERRFDAVDVVPDSMARRLLSIRAFDRAGMMVDAELAPGTEAARVLSRLLEDPGTAYLHAHYAVRGCFAARIERA